MNAPRSLCSRLPGLLDGPECGECGVDGGRIKRLELLGLKPESCAGWQPAISSNDCTDGAFPSAWPREVAGNVFEGSILGAFAPCLKVSVAGDAGRLRFVAGGMGGDEFVEGVVWVARPGKEVIDVDVLHVTPAVEAKSFLKIGERMPYPVEADASCTEEELVELVGIDEVGVPLRDE